MTTARLSVNPTRRLVTETLSDAADNALTLRWLGQAGFALRAGRHRLLIDPYLSDHLAEKYRGGIFPHERMMAAPLAPEDVDALDLVLCTHRHGDHMDPGTLPVLARTLPELRFVIPVAVARHARERVGLPEGRLIGVDAGDTIEPLAGLTVQAVAAAHETLETDDAGRHRFLGYVLDYGGLRLYHSGDCVPYEGLADTLRAAHPDVALLPVNGRDAKRRNNGVPGNFTLEEAVALCRETGIDTLIAHHVGMFDFNTLPPDRIDATADAVRDEIRLLRATTGVEYHLGGGAAD